MTTCLFIIGRPSYAILTSSVLVAASSASTPSSPISLTIKRRGVFKLVGPQKPILDVFIGGFWVRITRLQQDESILTDRRLNPWYYYTDVLPGGAFFTRGAQILRGMV